MRWPPRYFAGVKLVYPWGANATLNAGRVGAPGASTTTAIVGVLCLLPLTRPIFMGDNESDPPATGILIHEHHENHLGNVRDIVS